MCDYTQLRAGTDLNVQLADVATRNPDDQPTAPTPLSVGAKNWYAQSGRVTHERRLLFWAQGMQL